MRLLALPFPRLAAVLRVDSNMVVARLCAFSRNSAFLERFNSCDHKSENTDTGNATTRIPINMANDAHHRPAVEVG